MCTKQTIKYTIANRSIQIRSQHKVKQLLSLIILFDQTEILTTGNQDQETISNATDFRIEFDRCHFIS